MSKLRSPLPNDALMILGLFGSVIFALLLCAIDLLVPHFSVGVAGFLACISSWALTGRIERIEKHCDEKEEPNEPA